jgi:hypothetical protein
MALTSANDSFEKVLVTNLQRAIDFVKFAEAKNGALTAAVFLVATLSLPTSSASSLSRRAICETLAPGNRRARIVRHPHPSHGADDGAPRDDRRQRRPRAIVAVCTGSPFDQ